MSCGFDWLAPLLNWMVFERWKRENPEGEMEIWWVRCGPQIMDETEIYSKFVFAWILLHDWTGAEDLLMSKLDDMIYGSWLGS